MSPLSRTLHEALSAHGVAAEVPENHQRDSLPFHSGVHMTWAFKAGTHFPGTLQRQFLHLVSSASRFGSSRSLRIWSQFCDLVFTNVLTSHVTELRTKKNEVCLHTSAHTHSHTHTENKVIYFMPAWLDSRSDYYFFVNSPHFQIYYNNHLLFL